MRVPSLDFDTVSAALHCAALVGAVAFTSLAPAFPDTTTAWALEVRGANQPGGMHRFARLEGTPTGRVPEWTVSVECGLADKRGRETVTYRGTGTGGRGRQPGFGGQFQTPGGPLMGFLVDQPMSRKLDRLKVLFAAEGEDGTCGNGTGTLSTGD